MRVITLTTCNENGVGTSQQGPGTGFRPRIGVRGKLYAGMTGGGAASRTGNHKGCPYDGLAGGYFQRDVGRQDPERSYNSVLPSLISPRRGEIGVVAGLIQQGLVPIDPIEDAADFD